MSTTSTWMPSPIIGGLTFPYKKSPKIRRFSNLTICYTNSTLFAP